MTTTTSTSRRSSNSGIDATAISIAQADGCTVHIRCSTRADGDFHRTTVPLDELERRRRRFVDLAWTQLDQVHGTGVVRVDRPGQGDGAQGDIALTGLAGVVLGCWVGDCAPLVLVGASSEVAVVHAGWRGLAAGAIEVALGAFGEPVVRAVLGPTIGPCCYEFGPADLAAVAHGVGCSASLVTGRTSSGRSALDVPAAVQAACQPLEVERIGGCTGCDFPGFSHRVRSDPERHVVAVWRSTAVAT